MGVLIYKPPFGGIVPSTLKPTLVVYHKNESHSGPCHPRDVAMIFQGLRGRNRHWPASLCVMFKSSPPKKEKLHEAKSIEGQLRGIDVSRESFLSLMAVVRVGVFLLGQ